MISAYPSVVSNVWVSSLPDSIVNDAAPHLYDQYLTLLVMQRTEGSNVFASPAVLPSIGDNRTPTGGGNRQVGRELQFQKPPVSSPAAWRNEMERRLSETASEVSAMSKKIDLMLKLQMAGRHGGGFPASETGVPQISADAATPTDNMIPGGGTYGSPSVPSTIEKAGSAPGVSHETRSVDNLGWDAGKFPERCNCHLCVQYASSSS